MNDLPAALVIGDIDLVRAVDLAGIPVMSMAAKHSSAHWSRRTAQFIEAGDSWTSPDEVISSIESVARTLESPPVLIYGHDEDVFLLATHGVRLAKSVRFVSADPELALDLSDKSRFIERADSLGLPVPKTLSIHCRDNQPPDANDITFPVIAKPAVRDPARWPANAGRAKALRYDSPAHLASVWHEFQEIDSQLIIQEFLPGPERDIFSYHVYVDNNGDVAAEFGGRKLRTWPSEYGHSTSVEIIDDPDLFALGRDLVARMELRGVAKLDLKLNADGELRLLEVNPRFSLWHLPAAVAGVNFPAIVHADLCDLPRPKIELRAGIRWLHPVTDLIAARDAGIGLGEWLRFASSAESKHALAARDPLAGLGLGAELVRKVVRSKFGGRS